ncbi:MAG: hypothetical protein IPM29_08400 [Planctomycetes bacterium]|nr:hypothetical protein [Planctomycetota bacterium]
MRSLFIAVACSLAGPLGAQMVWTQVSSSGPSPRAGHAMVYDAARQRVLLFGGGQSLGDTWQWDGSSWTQVYPATSPPARFGHAMAFDAARGRVVLFGGEASAVLGDTWEWDGADWTQVSAVGPSARAWHAMAFDRVRGRVVLFGGSLGSGLPLEDTWEWDGTRWTQSNPAASPSRRHSHAMSYDAARRRVVLFGGFDITRPGPWLGDTWEWDGVRWVQAANSGPMPGSASAAYDARRERLVLQESYVRTWEWAGGSWRQVSGNHALNRGAHAMVYDAAHEQVVLFGGSSCSAYGGGCTFYQDTWTYQPTVRGDTASIGIGCPGSAGTPTLSALGPPIVGDQDFALGLGSVPGSANVFVGLSTRLAATSIPPCTVYPQLPFDGVLVGAAAGGTAVLPLPIPWNSALSGVDLFVQGGALESGGPLLGLASLTPGMQIRIGD